MSQREEIIKLLQDARVLNLVQAAYDNIGTECKTCRKAHEAVLHALAPFEEAREEKCEPCNGEGRISKSFKELAQLTQVSS
jgi:hypothetical protein